MSEPLQYTEAQLEQLSWLLHYYFALGGHRPVLTRETKSPVPGHLAFCLVCGDSSSTVFAHQQKNEFQEQMARFERLGITTTVHPYPEGNSPGKQYCCVVLSNEGLAEAVDTLLPSINDTEWRDALKEKMAGRAILQNPLNGKWLDAERAAEYFAAELQEARARIGTLEAQMRGGPNAPSLERRVASLIKDGREKG